MKQIVVLGSTGSIGRSALQVIKSLAHRFKVFGLVANTNWQRLLIQIKQFSPKYAGLADPQANGRLRKYLGGKRIRLCNTPEDIKRIISSPKVDIVLSAISGAAGLPFTLWAIEAGKTLALANKESLVMAGEIVMRRARAKGVAIRPVDSEHSAIFQALHCGKPKEVKRVILTASGGPFYNFKPLQLRKVTPRQALNHPTWQMGNKITIDSATLMNKALEIIEAKWLFGLQPHQIKVVIHPQSIIHSMVEFRDGSIITQMSKPDMKIPIRFALTYPERLPHSAPTRTGGAGQSDFIFRKYPTLSFQEPNLANFPALRLGYEVIWRGGTSGAVLNAANEEIVKLFLARKVSFVNIIPLVEKVLHASSAPRPYGSGRQAGLADIFEADAWARKQVYKFVASESKKALPLRL